MGTRYNRLAEAVLTSTHNPCFEKKYEKFSEFLFESFPCLVVNFLIYLNRRVFVMAVCKTKGNKNCLTVDLRYLDFTSLE